MGENSRAPDRKVGRKGNGPGSMLSEEYDELMNLKEICFGITRQYSLNCSPYATKKENIIFENSFVIREKGKIVSHVRVYPQKAVAGKCKVKIGAVGGVVVHPDYQGRGHMKTLLEYSITRMKRMGISISILWGDTQRYRHFGWETAGRKTVFYLNQRSVKEIKIGGGFTLRGYDSRKDVKKIADIHKKESLRISRSIKDYRQRLNMAQIQTWVSRGTRAYAALDGNEVIEFGGEPSIVAKLFAFLLNQYSFRTLKVHYPYVDSEMLRTLYEISSRWEVIPLGMIKIIDLKKTISSLKEQIQDKIKFESLKKGNSIILKMKDSNQKVNLSVGRDLKITDKESRNIVSLSDIEMVRLLFGPSPEEFGGSKEQKQLLNLLFPVSFYVWGLDHV